MGECHLRVRDAACNNTMMLCPRCPKMAICVRIYLSVRTKHTNYMKNFIAHAVFITPPIRMPFFQGLNACGPPWSIFSRRLWRVLEAAWGGGHLSS
jgi:hypothetical protein